MLCDVLFCEISQRCFFIQQQPWYTYHGSNPTPAATEMNINQVFSFQCLRNTKVAQSVSILCKEGVCDSWGWPLDPPFHGRCFSCTSVHIPTIKTHHKKVWYPKTRLLIKALPKANILKLDNLNLATLLCGCWFLERNTLAL